MSDVKAAFQQRFGSLPKYIARAPGRVEFVGNHTDYNGGEVLGAAVDRFLEVAVAPREDGRCFFASDGNPEVVEFPDTEEALSKGEGWVKYPLGVLALLREQEVEVETGFDFLVTSEIPSGAGLSSSAAFELASSIAFESLAGKELDRLTRVRVCRKAENEVVGVPCGILDQGVSGFGEKDRLVHIDCSSEVIHTVAGPEHTRLWIFESGKKHSLVDSLYSERNRECCEAFDLLKEKLPTIQFLVDVSPEELRQHESLLPAKVLLRARHVIEEHRRVQECVKLLAAGDLEAVGDLLCASHWSSSRQFENSIEELDTLVELLSEEDSVYGARLTGGGFGGAVMALCKESFDESDAQRVAEKFSRKYGAVPKFRGLAIADGAQRES
ncbi:MAG: galactokinase [Puniceicoccales bacterium]